MASSLYDTLRLHQSSASESDRPDFVASDRQFIDIYDTQNGNYNSGQVTFDLNSITSSSSFLDWQNSYLTVPIEATVQSTSGNPWTASSENQFALSLKNSNMCLLNGMTVTLANQTVVSLQQLSHIPMVYKLLTQFNSNDVDVYGPSVNFYKDTARSVASDASIGEINNQIAPSATALYGVDNAGRVARARGSVLNLADTRVFKYPSNTTGFLNPSGVDTSQRSYVSVATLAPADGATTISPTIKYTIHCQIPMKYIHDLFMKTPLIRGALWQITFHTHLPASFALTTTAGSTTVTAVNSTTLNGFLPFMLSPVSAVAETGLRVNAALGFTGYTATMKIGNSAAASCTLHACMYNLSPSVVTKYLQDPVKTVVFEDFIVSRPASLISKEPGFVRANITAGLARLRWMLIVPYLSGPQNGTLMSAGNISSFNSPFTSGGGGTVTPSSLTNFNVAIGSKNIYDKNVRFTYDMFCREQFGINTANGNAVDGLRTGLINETDFNSAYGYVAVNLERHAESSDKLPASVDIEFDNASGRTMSYVVYLFYEKEFSIDVLTGKMIV